LNAPKIGFSPSAALILVGVRAAIVWMTFHPWIIFPKTVKPPLLGGSRLRLLVVLMNHWLVAEFGLPPSLAIEMVRSVLDRTNSLTMADFCVTLVLPTPSWKRKPPPWSTPIPLVATLVRRWKKVSSQSPALI
jgi:hypothetical protein